MDESSGAGQQVKADKRIQNVRDIELEAITKKQNIELIVSKLQEKLKRQENDLKAIQIKTGPQEPSPVVSLNSEIELGPEHWMKIQNSLSAAGFDPGGIDGKPGEIRKNFAKWSSTRKAIYAWQGSLGIGVARTGRLTKDQIRLLIPKSGN